LIAFVSRQGRLCTLEVKTKSQRCFTEVSNSSHPSWSPIRDAIAVAAKVDANNEIFVVDIFNNKAIRLTPTNGYNKNSPNWSSDGKEIAFTASKTTSDSDIYIVASNGAGLKQLTSDGNENEAPTWQP